VDCTSVEGVGSTFYFTFDSVADACTPLVPLAPPAGIPHENATALAA
jgi:hypothetical protein